MAWEVLLQNEFLSKLVQLVTCKRSATLYIHHMDPTAPSEESSHRSFLSPNAPTSLPESEDDLTPEEKQQDEEQFALFTEYYPNFMNMENASHSQYSVLLTVVASVLRLNSKYRGLGEAKALISKNPQLVSVIRQCCESRSFRALSQLRAYIRAMIIALSPIRVLSRAQATSRRQCSCLFDS